MAAKRTYTTTVLADPDGSTMTALGVPFDPREVFGKVRAPVRVTVGPEGGSVSHTYRSTIASMGGAGGACWLIPLRASNRDAAGVRAGERVTVTLELDEAPRTVTPPPDLKKALAAAGKGAASAWESMGFSHQREHAEAIAGAKKPETRVRRIAACVTAMQERAAKNADKPKAPKGATKKPTRKPAKK